MGYIIATDTSSNIPTNIVEEKKILVISLSINIGGKEYSDINPKSYDSKKYYDFLKNGGETKTSQINPQKYVDALTPVLKDGNDVLFIGMSAGVSGSFASAVIAREQLKEDFPDRKIALVDSMGASMGEGLLVLKAVKCLEDGMSLDATAEFIESERMKMAQIFTVNDLMFLRRGGRLQKTAAIVGTILHIKPILKGNEEGKIVVCDKVRGRKSVIETLAQRYVDLAVDPQNNIASISHCDCLEDAQKLAELIKTKGGAKEVIIVEHEPITGSYLGSGGLALYFIGDSDVRLK